MAVQTPTRTETAAIIRSVLAAKYPREALPTIAANHHLRFDELKNLLDRAGYPDRNKMTAAVRHLDTSDTDPTAAPASNAPTDEDPILFQEPGTPFVAALPTTALFVDHTYQRELDPLRVERMAATFDIALVGIIEVSQRTDGRHAILDGQHRWATVRDVAFNTDDENPHVVCRVHRGLTVTQEAKLYHQLNTTRKQLTGWDRWLARRTAGEQLVLDIEACARRQSLVISMTEGTNVIRATKACENVVDLGGIQLLENVLALLRTAYPDDQAGLDAAIIQGLGHVLYAYTPDELDADRLVQSLATILPRQLTARSDAVREIHKGTRDRLTAHVIVERYNTGKGGRLQPFFDRVKPLTKTKGADARRNAAIREWAERAGLEPGKNLTRRIREAYAAAHPAAPEGPDA